MTLILAIESSCDETAAAVIENGQIIRSNVVASQIELHRRYGGVFPEVASRQHVLAIDTVIVDAMAQSGVDWQALDAVAVTRGPGLAGSLLVGVNAAKGVALANNLPLLGINHLEGHLYSNWLGEKSALAPIVFPVLTMIVSGGHTELVLMHNHGEYERLGQTIDDAAGEAFDKIARLLGLGYPGGPAVQSAAENGDRNAFKFPRAKTKGKYDFSFSGLKTAVLRAVKSYNIELNRLADAATGRSQNDALPIADLAASAQWAIIDALVAKTNLAVQDYGVKEVLLAGGVSANALLRSEMTEKLTCPVRFPPIALCTDNAAMIGATAHWHLQNGEKSSLDFDVIPNLKLL